MVQEVLNFKIHEQQIYFNKTDLYACTATHLGQIFFVESQWCKWCAETSEIPRDICLQPLMDAVVRFPVEQV